MPFQPHPNFKTPDDAAVLWRYMYFAKFIDLLETKSLWLCRLDLLDDPREGLYTDLELERLSKYSDGRARAAERDRSLGFVSCWRRCAGESMAMWDLYGAGGRGVAVKTTVGSLKSAIAGFEQTLYIGRVRYVPWKKYDEDTGNVLALYVRKTEAYGHEREVRLVFWSTTTEPIWVPGADVGEPINPERVARVLNDLAEFFPRADFSAVDGKQLVRDAYVRHLHRERVRHTRCGIPVGADLRTLIGEVVVGPRAQRWMLTLADALVERYGLKVNVIPSELSPPQERLDSR